MGLSRTEIELLIKARNQAQGAFDQLNGQVEKITGSAAKASVSMDDVGKKTKDAGVSAGIAGGAFVLLGDRIARGLVGAFNDTIKAANRLDAGLIGLGATASAFKVDAGAAQEAAKKLASDGLMSVGDAASGLKNLLAAGFGLDQATVLMNRFKDSAAFGRQGSLEFGQAIVGATEGIKNGNSALVDNAGLTKNLSNILVEAGFSAQDLSKVQSDVNVKQALYNGILKETNPQLGQTALYLNTAAGAQARFNSQIETAQQKIGKALQPALTSALSTLTPFIKAVGDSANVLVPLAAAVATVVVPLAAMKAAAALGVPSLTSLGASAIGLMTNLTAATASAGSLRGGLALMSTQAGFTVAELGLLKTAALVAGAAFIGWQLGKVIDELTGLSGVVERFAGAANRAALATETMGAKQDVLDRATKNSGKSVTDYTEAIKINAAAHAIQAAQFDKSAAAQLKRVDAELLLGRITVETANAQRASIEAEQGANAIRAKRLTFTQSLANSEKKYRDEIKATGFTEAELVAQLKNDENGFMAWAKQVTLGDDTIKRLKDSLTGHTKAQKDSEQAQTKAAAAAKAHEEQLNKQREALEKLGLVTKNQVVKSLDELAVMESRARQEGIPLDNVLRAMVPSFKDLHDKALFSGVGVEEAAAAYQRAKQRLDELDASIKKIDFTGAFRNLNAVLPPFKRLQLEEDTAAEKADKLAKAYQTLGVTSKKELTDLAATATYNFNLIKNSGTATPREIEAAHKAMVSAVNASTRTIAPIWSQEIFPKIKGVVEQIGTAVNGSFAQMLLGAKGFKDGFVDIWHSIKSGVLNIFNTILSAFLNKFLKGMLGALSGQQGAFSSAFSGLLGTAGGGTGGTGSGGLLSSILGIGTGGGGAAAAGGGAAGTGGIAGGSSGALGLGISGAALAGGAAAGGGGIALGLLGKKLFDGAGFKAGGFGAATGAAQGALIGSVVPVLGTVVGAGIGALAGFLSGYLGKKEGSKVNDARDQFIGGFGGSGTGEGSGFGNLAKQLAEAGRSDLMGKLLDAKKVKDFKAALDEVTAALDAQQKKTAEVAATTAKADGERSAAIDNLKAKLGTLDTEIGNLTQQVAGEAEEEVMGVTETLIREQIKLLQAQRDNVNRQLEQITDQAADGAQATAEAIQQVLGNLRIRVPVEYDLPDGGGKGPYESGGITGGYEPPVEGGAAGGVMANRPGLVLFGEGGEAEVGGPASFFRKIFESLNINGGGGGGGDTFIFQISTVDATGMEGLAKDKLLPMFIDAIKMNRRGSRTDLNAALGTS